MFQAQFEQQLQHEYINHQKTRTKQAWIDWMVERKPVAFLTITQPDRNFFITDDQHVQNVNGLLYRVNYKLFNKRFKRGEKHLHGWGVIEHQANGIPHTHMLIENDDVSIERLHSAIQSNVGSPTSRLNRIFEMNGIILKPVAQADEEIDHLAGYLQKEMKGFLIIDQDGLEQPM